MCLDYVTKSNQEPDPTEREGYKVFEKRGPGKYRCVCYRTIEDRPANEWLEDPLDSRGQPGVLTSTGYPYPFPKTEYGRGFHVFRDELSAQIFASWITRATTYVVVKVRYRQIVAEGMQDNCVVDVAREMMILEDR